jgi:hypothetical protein
MTEVGLYRVLVIAAEPHIGEALQAEIDRKAPAGEAEVRIVSPALVSSRLGHVMGDVDHAIGEARERLEDARDDVAEQDLQAQVSSTVGDADPLQAIDDALAEFSADEILVVTREEEDAAWLEMDLFERAKERFSIPVVHFEARDGARSPRETDRSGGDEGSEEAANNNRSSNLPRFNKRELVGIVVAVLGTVVLIVIAASSGDHLSTEGGLATNDPSSHAWRIVIAGVVALVNIAHVVGLLLFQAVGYRGTVARVFSHLSLWGTLLAIPVALLLG